MLEAGQVRTKNIKFVLYMTVMDSVVGCLCWFAVGFAFACGNREGVSFIGTRFFMGAGLLDAEQATPADTISSTKGDSLLLQWLLGLGFAGAAATIVSGALLERTRVFAHVALAATIVSWIYPTVRAARYVIYHCPVLPF